MNIGILGTGIVGQTLATHLIKKGHQVMLGSRNAGNENGMKWAVANKGKAGTFAEAAAFGDIVFNCAMGIVAPEAIKQAGSENLAKKILVDVSNPLDFSRGMPPRLTICNDNSMGEEIQRMLPDTQVVKALNTVNNELMTNPSRLNDGNFDLFICGNDEAAKAAVTELLVKEFGWKRECIIDLGGIIHARATESMLLFFMSILMRYGKPYTGVKVLKG